MCYLYLIRCAETSYYKIGIADSPSDRLVSLQLGCPYELILIMTCGFVSRTAAKKAEREIHQKLAHLSVQTEWFDLDKEQIDVIQHDMLLCNE